MKLLAINGSPRKKCNTAQLLQKIVAGAASQGTETELVHLIDLDFRGCSSCFACKLVGGKSYGRCAMKDDLTSVLQAAHEADILVLGTPLYFSLESAFMRALMERLCFQYYLYTKKKPPLSPKKKATALVYTMGAPEVAMPELGQDATIKRAQNIMEGLFGSCEVLLSCDTKQFDDYSKYEVDVFDVPAKLKRHEEVFPLELQKAFELGVQLVG